MILSAAFSLVSNPLMHFSYGVLPLPNVSPTFLSYAVRCAYFTPPIHTLSGYKAVLPPGSYKPNRPIPLHPPNGPPVPFIRPASRPPCSPCLPCPLPLPIRPASTPPGSPAARAP